MHCPPGWPLAAPLILAAGAATPGTDRLMVLSEDYHSREGKAGGTWDRCGPKFIQLNLPAPMISLLGPLMGAPLVRHANAIMPAAIYRNTPKPGARNGCAPR